MAENYEAANEEKSQVIIDYTEISKHVIDSLIKLGVLRKPNSTYKSTEALLYKYNDLKKSIKDREEEIQEIADFGLRGKSTSILKMPEGSKSSDRDIEQEIIDGLTRDIKKTQLVINRIDRVVAKYKNDPYGEIIKLKYFEQKTQQEIADFFEKDPTTIWRNTQRLINEIKVYFFPNDVIEELKSWQNAITHAIMVLLT